MKHIRPGLSALAGQIIGYRRNGTPIRLAAGGSVDGTSDTGGDNGDTTGGDDQADKDGQGNADKTPKIDGDYDPERAKRTIAAAREAEKKAKADKKALEAKFAAVLQAAGLAPDDKEDPAEQLKAARESAEKATARARQAAVELAVYKSAGKAGADPDAVLDSRGFLTAVADLDPDAEDFSDKVTEAIKAAVKANPKLSAAPVRPARQGADHSGGSGGPRRSTSLDAAVQRKLGG